jgi:lipopolysaccharide biosynthesis glycosyltransferase
MNSVEKAVASAVDDNYVWPLLVMLRSAKTTAKSPFRFILGFDENTLSSMNLRLIQKVCEIWKIDVSSVRINLDIPVEPGSYITSASYARLLLADILQERFLWIDADVLLQKGWDDFFEFNSNLEDNSIARAIRDPLVQFGIPDSQKENQAVVNAASGYFNAGVLLLNPDKWRNFNAPEKWRLAFENSSSLGFQFHDQCILNYVLSGYVELIPNEYNYLIRNDNGRLVNHPRIIHFAGGFKPWHMPEAALWVVAPRLHRDLYRKYAFYQHHVILSTFFSDPRAANYLWKERLRLRQTETFSRIIRQKKNWWMETQEMRAHNILRALVRMLLKTPVMKSLWNKHLEEIESQKARALFEISENHKNDIRELMTRFQDQRPAEIRELETISYGSYETFYSEPPEDLGALFDRYGSDKGTLGMQSVVFPWRSHNYADVYSEVFNQNRNSIRKVFECGIGTDDESFISHMTSNATPGGSLRAWREYFPNALIFGADVDTKILFSEDRIQTGYLDQLDSESIRSYFSSFEKRSFDLMIDDGLHTFDAAKNLLENSFEFLSETGLYIIEDVHYPEVLKYESYLRSKKYLFRIIAINRKDHVIGDNVLILINRPK